MSKPEDYKEQRHVYEKVKIWYVKVFIEDLEMEIKDIELLEEERSCVVIALTIYRTSVLIAEEVIILLISVQRYILHCSAIAELLKEVIVTKVMRVIFIKVQRMHFEVA